MNNQSCQAIKLTTAPGKKVQLGMPKLDDRIVMVIDGGRVVRFEKIANIFAVQGIDGDGI